MTESPLGPSGSGSVVLDLGPGAGALVLHTPPELNGAEIEAGAPGRPRTHSRVRPRLTARGTQHAAVYPTLAPGDYVVWRDADTPAMTITVTGGHVTTAWWPEPDGALSLQQGAVNEENAEAPAVWRGPRR